MVFLDLGQAYFSVDLPKDFWICFSCGLNNEHIVVLTPREGGKEKHLRLPCGQGRRGKPGWGVLETKSDSTFKGHSCMSSTSYKNKPAWFLCQRSVWQKPVWKGGLRTNRAMDFIAQQPGR